VLHKKAPIFGWKGITGNKCIANVMLDLLNFIAIIIVVIFYFYLFWLFSFGV